MVLHFAICKTDTQHVSYKINNAHAGNIPYSVITIQLLQYALLFQLKHPNQ